MNGFYLLPDAFTISVSTVGAAALAVNLCAAMLGFIVLKKKLSSWADGIFDTLVSLWIFVTAWSTSVITYSINDGYVVSGFSDTTFILLFAAVAISGIIACISDKKAYKIITVGICAASLPPIQNPYIIAAVAVLLLARGVLLCILRIHKLRSSVSALSVKSAIDSLHTGIIFCQADGTILLINRNMIKLAELITGSVPKDGMRFFKMLLSEPSAYMKTAAGEDMVFKLSDKNIRRFSKAEIIINKRKYTQITATDVTELWRLTEELRSQNEVLKQHGRELAVLLSGISDKRQTRELLSAKSRVHDILGQRITVLQKWLASDSLPSPEAIHRLTCDLSERLRTDNEAAPERKLRDLISTFADIEVEITVSGALPDNTELAEAFIQILREASTNAVRHGLATKITAKFEKGFRLTVSDNGISAELPIIAGGGVKGMVQKAKMYGGKIYFIAKPCFTAIAEIPEKNYGGGIAE